MHTNLPQTYFANVPDAKKALHELERQGESAKTYDELAKLIGIAKAIKLMHAEMTEVRQAAEWTLLSLRRVMGKRIIETVPKATGRQPVNEFQPKVKFKRGDLPMNHQTRALLLKLAKFEKPQMRRLAENLWTQMLDATLKAVIEISKYGDFKKARSKREKNLADRIKELPDKKYGVILADPEWKFKTYSEKGKVRTSADKHYPTSELADIANRKPPAAKDCVLFLWATAPMLPEALSVMKAWGFKYVSNYVWDKMKPGRKGTGYWAINHHEHLLVGKRGHPIAPAPGTQWSSIIREKWDNKKHSAKPTQAYEMIESYYPNTPKIELNLRGKPRPGWDGWGNEAE